MKHQTKTKLLSIFMALCMVVSMVPVNVFAAETDNLCDHHTAHTADCGYVAAVAGVDCGHEHDDTGAVVHTEGCGYVAPVAGSDCTHAHDDTCGYAAAQAEVPCAYECAECAAGEETAAAEIEGVSITVDGTTYTSGTLTLSPNSGDATINIVGSNLGNGNDDNAVKFALNTVYGEYWTTVTADTAKYTLDSGVFSYWFSDTAVEVQYCNDWETNRIWQSTGLYVLYDADATETGYVPADGTGDDGDDSTGGEVGTTSARIEGVSITVDGVTVDSTTGGGSLTITPTSTVIFTLSGTNFANLSTNNVLWYAPGFGEMVIADNGYTINTTDHTATRNFSIGFFTRCSNYEVLYSNDGESTQTGTGIYLTYDDGSGEEDTTTEPTITVTKQDGTALANNAEIYDGDVLTSTVTGIDSPSYKWFLLDAESNEIVLSETAKHTDEINGNRAVVGCADYFVSTNVGDVIGEEGNQVLSVFRIVKVTAANFHFEFRHIGANGHGSNFEGVTDFNVRYSNDGGETWTDSVITLKYAECSGHVYENGNYYVGVTYHCSACDLCGYVDTESEGNHSYEDGLYKTDAEKHYPLCDVCKSVPFTHPGIAHDEATKINATGGGTHQVVYECCGYVKETVTCSGGTATCTDLAECEICGKEYGSEDANNHASEETYINATGGGSHEVLYTCCEAVKETVDCSGGEATCKNPAECEICGEAYGEVDPNAHDMVDGECTRCEHSDHVCAPNDSGLSVSSCCRIIGKRKNGIATLSLTGYAIEQTIQRCDLTAFPRERCGMIRVRQANTLHTEF